MINNSQDIIYMNRCLELAILGMGHVAPNPMVGSVVVYNNTIIGEGYHKKFGEAHAEVNAIASVKDKSLLKESTIYVNLEPCSHYGKTPPCSDLIIKSGIPRVVVGNIDPNPQVQGKGIEKLKNAGVTVSSNTLNSQGEALNKRFFTFQRKKRPYIILKWQTRDGYIDIIRNSQSAAKPNWITNQYARMMVHKWRSEEQAILVGTNTALNDNPKLNVRDWHGNNPLRVVIDRSLRLPQNLHLFDGSLPTLIITEKNEKDHNSRNIIYHNTVFDGYLPEKILAELYRRNIQSVFIEGGAKLIQSFINAGLWDEARVFTGTVCFKEGIPAPTIQSENIKIENWSGFTLRIYQNSSS